MSEFGQALLQDVSRSFNVKLQGDRKIRNLAKKIRDGTSYADAGDYAVRIGELLSASILENTGTLSYMSEEVARELLEPLLTVDHDMIAEVCRTVQENMNQANGLGINALVPDLDTNRIEGLITAVASKDTIKEAATILGESIVNYSQSVADQAMRKNSQANAKIGLKTTIKRSTGPFQLRTVRKGKRTYTYASPCKWCSGLAGSYDYEDVKNTGNDVFRRHENCRCTVTYQQGDMRQDVWSKASWTGDDANRQADAVSEAKERQEAEKAEKARRSEARRSNLQYLMEQTGYSAKGASIALNQYSDKVQKYGIQWLVDYIHDTNPATYRRRMQN